jgi:hypothetical protein
VDGGHGASGGLASKPMNGLTWLHLSDWHQRRRDFDLTGVRDALVRDIHERVKIDPALAEVNFTLKTNLQDLTFKLNVYEDAGHAEG